MTAYRFRDVKFESARKLFRLACQFRKEHTRRHVAYCHAYGTNSALISGGFYDHWPNAAKDTMRNLNREAQRLMDAGFAARPARVRMETMRRLWREVKGECGVHS